MGNIENKTTTSPSSEQEQEQQIEEEHEQQQQQEEGQPQEERPEEEKEEKKHGEVALGDTDVIAVLLCSFCQNPLCSVEEILPHRADDAWKAHVYAYELDLFNGCSPMWCYSATNPSTRRFDIVRCNVSTAMRLRGPWSREHSFFLDHEWCYGSCSICDRFVGWGFRPLQSITSSSSSLTAGTVQDESKATVAEQVEAWNEQEDTPDEAEGEEKVNEEDEDKESEETYGEEVLIAPDGGVFVGLIITHCVGDEKFPRSVYETLQCRRQAVRLIKGA